MAGAVAFVFGLCALSFAAGCVVTAIMLRPSSSEEDVRPPVEPVVPAPPPEQPEVRLLAEDLGTKPIHRNPVVSRPVPVALEPVSDPTFTGVFDPADDRDVELVEDVDELADEVPELLPDADAPTAEPVVVPARAAKAEAPRVSPEAARFFIAYAARQAAEPRLDEPVEAPGAPSRNDKRRETKLELVPRPSEPEPAPRTEPPSATEPLEPAAETSEPAPRADSTSAAEALGPVCGVSEAESRIEPAPAADAPDPAPEAASRTTSASAPEPLEPAAEVPEPAPQIEPTGTVRAPKPVPAATPTPATEASGAAASEAEPEAVFASRSGLVTEAVPVPVPEPDSARPEAVVPEQGACSGSESVRAHRVLVPNVEFRERYLRTFEAARRRSSH